MLHIFYNHVLNILSIFRCMLQMFHLDVSKVDQVLDMLQWRRWLADSGLPQGFGSYLARRASPSPLLSLPSLPFPPSCHGSLSSAGKPYQMSMHMPVELVALGGGAMPAWWPQSKPRSAPSAHYARETSSRRYLSGRPDASNAQCCYRPIYHVQVYTIEYLAR